MFLNHIKDFFLLNKIKKSFENVKSDASNSIIKKIGIICDETKTSNKELLIKQLVANGVDNAAISLIIFKDKIYKNEIFDTPTFSNKDLNWSGNFDNAEVNYFLDQKFDLLINYYDVEKLPLIQLSNVSKACFKVGFSEIDKRINHFIIKTSLDNHKVFVDELFKYLKILKKI